MRTTIALTTGLALVVAALPAFAGTSGAHYPRPASSVKCANVNLTPNSDDVVAAIRARGTTCTVARRVARQQATTGRNTLGYTCTSREHADEVMPHVDVRCRKGASRVITFADY